MELFKAIANKNNNKLTKTLIKDYTIIYKGRTLLHQAVVYRNIEIATQLLEYGIEYGINVDDVTSRGNTPLQIASEWGDLNMIKLLLTYGADIEKKGRRILTPLYCAYSYNNKDTMKLLLNHGAKIPYRFTLANTLAPLSNDTKNIGNKAHKLYQNMIQNEWRPWNHSIYTKKYRQSIQTLALLAKI